MHAVLLPVLNTRVTKSMCFKKLKDVNLLFFIFVSCHDVIKTKDILLFLELQELADLKFG